MPNVFFLSILQAVIKIHKNASLLPFNTFHVAAQSKYLCHVRNIDQLIEVINTPTYAVEEHLILGGGSNILFGSHFNGLVIKVAVTGIERVKETEDHIWLKAHSGEIWDNLVSYAVSNNWGGIENLALIPGMVGAAPIQNIGAYGTEVKDVVDSVEAIDMSSGKIRKFTKDECELAYRESVFKNSYKGRFFVLSVTLVLTKKNHVINTQYGALNAVLQKEGAGKITIQAIRKAVMHIRRHKLPNPDKIGNAGSFFKNPIIPLKKYDSLQQLNADMPSYYIDNYYVKVPAGWLIEKCGWKGKRVGAVGVHTNQALILVNYGDGSGKEILSLAEEIQRSVWQQFQIKLFPEVTIVQ